MPSGSATETTGPEDSPLADPDVRERLRPLPPSAKLVARVLAENGPLPKRDLEEWSLLPRRTVEYALTRLKDADLVVVRPSPRNAREQVYVLQS